MIRQGNNQSNWIELRVDFGTYCIHVVDHFSNGSDAMEDKKRFGVHMYAVYQSHEARELFVFECEECFLCVGCFFCIQINDMIMNAKKIERKCIYVLQMLSMHRVDVKWASYALQAAWIIAAIRYWSSSILSLKSASRYFIWDLLKSEMYTEFKFCIWNVLIIAVFESSRHVARIFKIGLRNAGFKMKSFYSI